MNRLKGKKILVVIAHEKFRDEEYEIPRKALEAEGAGITVASTDLSPAKGKLGLDVKPDVILKNVSSDNYDAVIFVGGPGCKGYWDDGTAHDIAKKALAAGKLLTAICSAPVILAKAGVLKGKKATCFPDDKEKLKEAGAEYISKDVVTDGKIITASGYWAAIDFAAAIIAELQ